MDIDQNNQEEKEEKENKEPTNVERYPFGAFAAFLSRVLSTPKSSKKRELLEKLWTGLKNQNGKTYYYPLMRLLLPQLDLERSGYGIKEKKIADLYIKAIPLTPQSNDAKKIMHYKNPKYAGLKVGDFANVIHDVLKTRCISSSNKTIFDVNNDLNNLQKNCGSQQLKILFFQNLMTNYTANEQLWLIRIILKDLKCGVRHESCLKAFHKIALDTYNMTSSLKKVCELINNPNANNLSINGVSALQIELFTPIKPMLASRRHWNQVIDVMGNKFGIEIKFDGERVMIHYRKNEKIMLWSRNCIDLEAKYGYVKSFGDIICKQFKCNSCIIDGEMMAWDNDLNAFIPFGSNRTVAQEQDINKNLKQHLCYIAFDVLMIDDEIVMDLTLSRRRQFLETNSIFQPKKTYLEYTRMITNINDTTGIMNALDEALQQHHEGIMVKSLKSIYQCNKRGNDWIKLKPDYVDDMISSLDLIILGGYFGEGKRRVGDISHFLLGCKENTNTCNDKAEMDDDDDDDDDMDIPTKFYSFCKVGSGYKIDELKQLQNHLRSHWKQYRINDINKPQLKHLMGWKPEPSDIPDVWIEPKNSIILELLANEIVPTKNYKFAAGLTVRFPRCKRFRYDKPWYQCISLSEIRDKYNNKESHHHARTAAEIAILLEEDGSGPSKKRRRITHRNAPSVMNKFLPADISNINIESSIFENKEFCVLNGMELMDEKSYNKDINNDYMQFLKKFTKQELEKKIVSNGGIITQNPLIQSTNYLIAEKLTVRVKNLIYTDRCIWNIIRPLWLIQSIENHRILPFQPNHMIYSTKSTKNLLNKTYDKYGDHYSRPINIENLTECFRTIGKYNNKNIKLKTDDDDDDDLVMNDNNWIKSSWMISSEEEMMLIGGWNRFKKCIIYLDYYETLNIDCNVNTRNKIIQSSSLRMIETRVRLYGGIISKYLDTNVTHIIVDEDNKPRPRLQSIHKRITDMMNDINYKYRPYLVTSKWVEDSIIEPNIIANYHPYHPRTLAFPQR